MVVHGYGRKEMFYLTTHSTHFILRLYGIGHMVKDHSDHEGSIRQHIAPRANWHPNPAKDILLPNPVTEGISCWDWPAENAGMHPTVSVSRTILSRSKQDCPALNVNGHPIGLLSHVSCYPPPPLLSLCHVQSISLASTHSSSYLGN